jgi:hypothetical protein
MRTKRTVMLFRIKFGIFKHLLLSFIIYFWLLPACAVAQTPLDAIKAQYPFNLYIIGVTEIPKTGNQYNDRRVAEIHARLEIAKQIKVRMESETLDMMCEGPASKLFDSKQECKSQFVSIIRETVDEFLKGSKIVEQGEKGDTVYAVAVMPRKKAVEELDKNLKDSIDKTKENVEKVKEGDKEALKNAEEEYKKAVVYDKEKELIEGVRKDADKAFEELEKELVKLKERQ